MSEPRLGLPAWLDGAPIRRACGIALGLFALLLLVPWQPADEAPIGAFDFSWMLVLHDAVATGRQFGKEIILPQGPLGFIGNDVYDPRTHAVVLLIRSAIAATLAAVLWRAARVLVRRPLLALLWLVPVVALVGRSADHLYPSCAALAIFSYFVVNDRQLGWDVYALIGVLAMASLIKVNQPFYAVVTIGTILLDALVLRRDWRRSWIVPAVYLGALALCYLAARQRPSSLGTFLWGWAQVTLGHADAVGLPGPWVDPAAYLIVVAMVTALVGVLGWRRWRAAGLLPAAGTTGVLLLLYKHSFMRQDIAHVHMGPMAAAALALLYTPPLWCAGARRIRLACVVTLVIAAGVLTSILASYTGQSLAGYAGAVVSRTFGNAGAAIRHVSDPSQFRRDWEHARAVVRQEVPIPTAKIEGDVDVYPHRQDVVLAYDLPYRPRPVISSLVATSAVLGDVNARRLRDDALAARTVLFDVELVDRNFPTILDGASLPELLTRYDVVDATGGMLVLRRSPAPRTYRFTPLTTLRASFDKPFAIPTSAAPELIWAKFRFKTRTAGRVVAMLYKPPTLGIEVHTRGTEPESYRLLPSLANEQGFLLSPLISHRRTYAALATNPSSMEVARHAVTAVKVFVADDSPEMYFDDDFEIELTKLDISPER
jgi:hypothetical protein